MSALPFSPASERNKHPILEQLQRLLSTPARVLEIGSGWGQHAVYFAGSIQGIEWHPSERPQGLPDLLARLLEEGNVSIQAPIPLDVLKHDFPADKFDAVYSANTAHIMAWEAVVAMFSGVGQCLEAGGQFILYGPFNIGGQFTSESNQAFDQGLRNRNTDMGIRDLEALETLATCHQMKLVECITMPANNLLLVFEKI
jgi:cyclopropane fatty-acyl-phospholipid synthase-like methyltransferase